MMRRLLAALGLAATLGCGGGTAQAVTCTVPFTFVNNTQIADANQVNANFTAILTCFVNLFNTAIAINGNLTVTGNITASGSVGVGTDLTVSGAITAPNYTIRKANPTNFYVSTAGNDANPCTLASKCKTIQHTIDYAVANYDAGGGNIIINIGAGTFNEAVTVAGPLPGAAAANESGAILEIIGNGSGSTFITLNSCGIPSALFVGAGAYVKFNHLKLTSSFCAGGVDLVVYQHAVASLAGGDVEFGAGGVNGAIINVFDHSTFNTGYSNYGFKISGSAAYGILLSTFSSMGGSDSATYTLTGTPNFPLGFVVAIDNSLYTPGTNWAFSGAATGPSYVIANNSTVDTEQIAFVIPGSTPGFIGGSSFIDNNLGLACIGGATVPFTCRDAVGPTGLGGAGVATLSASSGDYSGVVHMVPGAGAAAIGVVHVATPSIVVEPGSLSATCVASVNQLSAGWAAGSAVQSQYVSTSTTGSIILYWSNAGVALTNGTPYDINYSCQ